MKTFEEVSDAVKKFKEGIVARAYSVGRLKLIGYQKDSAEGRHAQ